MNNFIQKLKLLSQFMIFPSTSELVRMYECKNEIALDNCVWSSISTGHIKRRRVRPQR